MENNVWLALVAIISYLLGSVPSSYLITRKMSGKDIRASGSGNIGAMNTFRVIQEMQSTRIAMIAFLLVLLGDAGKAALAIFVTRWLGFLQYDPGLAFIISSFFLILGHNYSVFFRFKSGGRGIACLMGILLALDWHSFFVWGGTIIIVIFIAQQLLIGKINWQKFDEVFSIIGSQIVGRVGGMIIALAPLYFLNLRLFFPILAATVLVIMKHIERVRNYMAEMNTMKVGAGEIKHGTKNNP